MAIPGRPMQPMPIGPENPSIGDIVAGGGLVRTNRDNQGSWTSYLDSLRRAASPGGENWYETPNDRPTKPVRPNIKPPPGTPGRNNAGGGTRSRSGKPVNIGDTPTSPRFGAGQQVAAGQDTANYSAGLRRYGAGMRSAPNVGAVRNKAGYNERDRRNERLATGDEMQRVRLMGG